MRATGSGNVSGLTAARVKDLLLYSPTDGSFVWRKSTAQCVQVGAAAGGYDAHGYLRIKIGGKCYKAHRLAWLYEYGEWPIGHLDHANGQRDDNRIANLRLATPAQNRRNSRRAKNNTSGFKGVTFHKGSGRWRASIQVDRRAVTLGGFVTAEDAYAAYVAAAKRYFGEFARAA